MTGKDDYRLPYNLENMSIPELEALLQQDFIASDGAAPDVDYIMAIMEVIQAKKRALPNYQPMDAEQAWEEFQSLYITEEGRANSIYRSEPEESENHIPEIADHKSKRKKNRTIINRFVIAALIAALLAATLIPVSGYANVIQMAIAYWTDDYFSFAPEHRTPGIRTQETAQTVPAGFEDLQDFAIEHSITDLMIPQYIPDGFQVADVVLTEFDLTSGFEFCVVYTKLSDYISITIISIDDTSGSIYEKDNNDVEIYELGNTEYNRNIFSCRSLLNTVISTV